MKETWSLDAAIILEELNRLIATSTPIVMSRNDFPPQTVFVREYITKNDTSIYRVEKHTQFAAGPSSYFFFYRPMEHLNRGFQASLLQDNTGYFFIMLPQEIFQIQRRKFPRVRTPNTSHALFTTLGGAKLIRGILRDVSLEGAYMHGVFTSGIKAGITIGPIALSLNLNCRAIDPITIHIPQATVTRIVEEHSQHKMAIHFKLHDKAHFDMENYINLRSMETE